MSITSARTAAINAYQGIFHCEPPSLSRSNDAVTAAIRAYEAERRNDIQVIIADFQRRADNFGGHGYNDDERSVFLEGVRRLKALIADEHTERSEPITEAWKMTKSA